MLMQEDIDQARSNRGIGTIGSSCLLNALYAILAGLDSYADELVRKSVEWIEIAIHEGERPADRYVENEHEAMLLTNLGLARWLMSNQLQTETFKRSFETMLLALKAHVEWPFKHHVSQLMLTLQYEWIEASLKKENVRQPSGIPDFRKPSDIVWMLCRSKTSGVPDHQLCKAVMDGFLLQHIPQCMGLKQGLATWLDLPSWMYIYHQHFATGLTAVQAVRDAVRFVTIREGN